MKKTIFILITILAATASFAQDASNDSIRKRIREMKLSEEYVYAESGSITDFAEAKPAASEKLHAAAITPSTIEIVRLWSSCARFLPSRDFWTSTATSFLTMPLLPSQMAILETTTAVSTRCVQE